MLEVNFTSYRIKKYEKANKCDIYAVIGLSTHLVSELLKIATGSTNDEEVCDYLDELKKQYRETDTEYKGLRGVLWYLIDELEDGGFFTYLTASEVKSLILQKEAEMKRLSMLSEKEKEEELKMKMEKSLEKLLLEVQKNTGIKNGKNLKLEQD